MKVDTVKIENRYAPAEDLALAEFLDVYNETNAYLIDTLPKEMSKDFNLPDCLLCGGFTERLQVCCFTSPVDLSRSVSRGYHTFRRSWPHRAICVSISLWFALCLGPQMVSQHIL